MNVDRNLIQIHQHVPTTHKISGGRKFTRETSEKEVEARAKMTDIGGDIKKQKF